MPGMLATVSYNLARQNNKVGIFEVGRAYFAKDLPLTEFPVEKPMLCMAFVITSYSIHYTKLYEVSAIAALCAD